MAGESDAVGTERNGEGTTSGGAVERTAAKLRALTVEERERLSLLQQLLATATNRITASDSKPSPRSSA